MEELESIFNLPPYGVPAAEKQQIIVKHLNLLNAHHVEHCQAFRDIQQAYGKCGQTCERLEDFPFLPIRLFKEFELKSVAQEAVVKTLTSSGTTSDKVSKIHLDKITSRYQTKALAVIVKQFIGKTRLPMLIIDSKNVLKDRRMFSARGAGILGLSNFGRDHLYLLDDDMNLRLNELQNFLERYQGERILLFGFTFMVWQHFYRELAQLGSSVDLSKGILIHSGGWKKLTEQAVDSVRFARALREVCGIERVHNFYGMVEQIGSVFMECSERFFHAPIFSDIIVRDPQNWAALGFRQPGVIELMSILPHSYPGHVLLTEDTGEILGEDDCACGLKGKYFRVIGRIPKAELRGCSDTYAFRETANAV